MAPDRHDIDFIDESARLPGPRHAPERVFRHTRSWVPVAFAALLIGALAGYLTLSGDPDEQVLPDVERLEEDGTDGPEPGPPERPEAAERLEAVLAAQSVPRALLAAELYHTAPSAESLRELFDVVGGFEGLELGTAEGVFDVVGFDPLDSTKLLASDRRSYGDAENQARNEVWRVAEGDVEQQLWMPLTSHDFAHFNTDGTATMWVHGGGAGFAARTATILSQGEEVGSPTAPLFASRFAASQQTIFALTGNGDYYTHETGYVDLVAARGGETRVLADGSLYDWIDAPTTDLLLAYPVAGAGSTTVWDISTLERLDAHPLAGRTYQRLAVSGDGRVAVGVRDDGVLEVVELESGNVVDEFGRVDVQGIDQAVTLNQDGTVAVTVERSGRVSLWWVGHDDPVAVVRAGAWQPRWVSAEYAPMTASAVARNLNRVALLIPARAGEGARWVIVDTSTESWIERACEQAGRRLRDREVQALGLGDRPQACNDDGIDG